METIALIASIVSIIIAFFAIWQANHHRDQSDKLNRDTTEKLARIEACATSTKEEAFEEIRRWGDFARAGGKGLEEAEKAKEEDLRKLKEDIQATTAEEINKVLQTVESKLSSSTGASTISEIKKEFEELKKEMGRIQVKGITAAKKLERESKFRNYYQSLEAKQKELLKSLKKQSSNILIIDNDMLRHLGISTEHDERIQLIGVFLVRDIAYSAKFAEDRITIEFNPEFAEFLKNNNKI